jgi:hypothetical protein
MDNAKLQAKFDTAVDNYELGDEISIENANHEMHENWRNFLEAGFDADLVAKMMAPEDIWDNYQDLTMHGAKIDIVKLVGRLFDEVFIDDSFIKEHWGELVDRGASPDFLADRCYGDVDIASIADLEEALTKGISINKIFDLTKGWLEIRDEWPEDQAKILTWLHDHGLPKADIKEWLTENANSYMEDYIIESGSDFYEKFDMTDDDDTIVSHWLSRYGYQYFSEISVANLPIAVGIDSLLEAFSIEEIFKYCSPYAFSDFIDDYLDSGCNINILAQKFMDEVGYDINKFISKAGHYIDSRYSDALLYLIDAEPSTDIIDPMKCIELIDASKLDDRDARYWYDYLEEKGYDSQLIAKFLRKD